RCCSVSFSSPTKRCPKMVGVSNGLKALAASTRSVLRNRHYVGYATTITLTTSAVFGYIAASPFVLQDIIGLSACRLHRPARLLPRPPRERPRGRFVHVQGAGIPGPVVADSHRHRGEIRNITTSCGAPTRVIPPLAVVLAVCDHRSRTV